MRAFLARCWMWYLGRLDGLMPQVVEDGKRSTERTRRFRNRARYNAYMREYRKRRKG